MKLLMDGGGDMNLKLNELYENLEVLKFLT
jgi:hypothetical protein